MNVADWKHDHFFEGFEGEFPDVRWQCSCGAYGSERRHDLAGEAYRRHLTEAEAAA